MKKYVYNSITLLYIIYFAITQYCKSAILQFKEKKMGTRIVSHGVTVNVYSSS